MPRKAKSRREFVLLAATIASVSLFTLNIFLPINILINPSILRDERVINNFLEINQDSQVVINITERERLTKEISRLELENDNLQEQIIGFDLQQPSENVNELFEEISRLELENQDLQDQIVELGQAQQVLDVDQLAQEVARLGLEKDDLERQVAVLREKINYAPLQPFDFFLSSDRGLYAVAQGRALGRLGGPFGLTDEPRITVTNMTGNQEMVSLTLTRLPSGIRSYRFSSDGTGTPPFRPSLYIQTNPDIIPGTYVITVTAIGGGLTRSTSFQLIVTGDEQPSLPPPSIFQLGAPLGQRGETMELSILGSDFSEGATVSFSPPLGITVTSQLVLDPTEIRVTILITDDAPLGDRDVIVTNPDKQGAYLNRVFRVIG